MLCNSSQVDSEAKSLRITKRTQWGFLIDYSTTYTVLLFVYVYIDLIYNCPRGWWFNPSISSYFPCHGQGNSWHKVISITSTTTATKWEGVQGEKREKMYNTIEGVLFQRVEGKSYSKLLYSTRLISSKEAVFSHKVNSWSHNNTLIQRAKYVHFDPRGGHTFSLTPK